MAKTPAAQPDQRAREIAGKLSKAEREAVSGAALHASGGTRVHFKHAGPTMRALTRHGILAPESSYLTPLGQAVRTILSEQTHGS